MKSTILLPTICLLANTALAQSYILNNDRSENYTITRMDANGDGLDDVLVMRETDNRWHCDPYADGTQIFYNTGDDTFERKKISGKHFQATRIGDINGDGIDDVLGTTMCDENGMFLSSPTGHKYQRLQGNVPSHGGAIGDYDGDGDVDIFVIENRIYKKPHSHNVGVYENVDGKFMPYKRIMRGHPWSIELVDWDADGDLDIVTGGSNNDGQLVVAYNNKGKFSKFKSIGVEVKWHNDIWFHTQIIKKLDVDSDGDLDLVQSTGLTKQDNGPKWNDINLYVFENTASGFSNKPYTVNVGDEYDPDGAQFWAKDLYVEDLNRDGVNDIVVNNLGTVERWYANGFPHVYIRQDNKYVHQMDGINQRFSGSDGACSFLPLKMKAGVGIAYVQFTSTIKSLKILALGEGFEPSR